MVLATILYVVIRGKNIRYVHKIWTKSNYIKPGQQCYKFWFLIWFWNIPPAYCTIDTIKKCSLCVYPMGSDLWLTNSFSFLICTQSIQTCNSLQQICDSKTTCMSKHTLSFLNVKWFSAAPKLFVCSRCNTYTNIHTHTYINISLYALFYQSLILVWSQWKI